jgi:hypothetical protein
LKNNFSQVMRLLNSIINLLHFNQKNWKAVSLCVLAAAIFWFFNALNKNYTTTISFPLQFDFDRQDYMPVRPLEEELRINVTGMGWDIFRRTVGLRKSPLSIPLEHPETVKKIVGSTLPAFFSTQLEAFQINFVANDTNHWAAINKPTPSGIHKSACHNTWRNAASCCARITNSGLVVAIWCRPGSVMNCWAKTRVSAMVTGWTGVLRIVRGAGRETRDEGCE